MQYVFTHHALERMEVRGIREKQVIKAIEESELKEIVEGKENIFIIYKTFDPTHHIKVIIAEEEDRVRIITVYMIRSIRVKKVANFIDKT